MAEGYARVTVKTRSLACTHLGPGLFNAVTGNRQRLAGFHSHGRDRGRCSLVLLWPPSPPGSEYVFGWGSVLKYVVRFAKRVYRVDHVEDLPRVMERAFHLSVSGRPGPVLVDVPMDHFSLESLSRMHSARCAARDFQAGAGPSTAQRIVETLAHAKNPVLYAGGGVTSALAARGARAAGRAGGTA